LPRPTNSLLGSSADRYGIAFQPAISLITSGCWWKALCTFSCTSVLGIGRNGRSSAEYTGSFSGWYEAQMLVISRLPTFSRSSSSLGWPKLS
jgi:hypothetical protein